MKTQQNTLNILTHYTKPNISRNSKSEGHSFDHISSDIRDNQTYDKAYCKDKEWYNCHKKVHPSSHCLNKSKKKDDNDDKSKSIKEIKASIKNLPKYMKNAKKTLTNLQDKTEELK